MIVVPKESTLLTLASILVTGGWILTTPASIPVVQECESSDTRAVLVAQEAIFGLLRPGPVADVRLVVEVWSVLVVEFSSPFWSGCWNDWLRSGPDLNIPVLITLG